MGTAAPNEANDDEAVIIGFVGAVVVVVAALLNADANDDFPKRLADPNPTSDLGVPKESSVVGLGNENAGLDSYAGGFETGMENAGLGSYDGGSDEGKDTTGFTSTTGMDGFVSATVGAGTRDVKLRLLIIC